MFRPLLAFFSLAAAAMLFPCTANAWLWGLFGSSDAWRIDPAVQDVKASELMQKAQYNLDHGRPKHAMKCYWKVWKKYTASKYTSEALFDYGRTGMSLHRWKKSLKAYTILVKSYPENPHFNQIIADMFTIGDAYERGLYIHYCWIIPYKDRSKASMAYGDVVALAPFSDEAPIALVRVAMIQRNMHELAAGIDAADRVINDYPNSTEAPNGTLLVANYMATQVLGPAYDQGATHDAMDFYRDFLTLYPNNPAVKFAEVELAKNRDQYSQSKYLMGVFFYKYRDDYDSASVFFNDCITNAPESNSAKQSREYLDLIARIKARFPNGDWPRRSEWGYLRFWHHWNPLTEPSPHAVDSPEYKKAMDSMAAKKASAPKPSAGTPAPAAAGVAK
jgi:outer membrane protein assembly factor BamD